MFRSLLLSYLLRTVIAAPLDAARRANPTVTIANGTVIGNTILGVENFKGIPYAQPPTGHLRLRPPQPLDASFGTFESELIPKACPQLFASPDSSELPAAVAGLLTESLLFQEITLQDEDCLTLNIQRPVGTASDAKLPVVFWIFGGAFSIGGTSLYDGTRVVQKAVALDQPIIFVAINYRLGGFGFLPGKEVSADGSSNLGLKDQRLALQWVQDNIAAFGGDPSKVTLWGESAGAISICDQTTADGGDISYKGGKLFRAAIMNSGSTTPTVPVDHPKAQKIYDTVVQAGGCAHQADSLACLRALPYQSLRDAFDSVPAFLSYTSIDLSYLPRPDPADPFFQVSPEVAIQSGAYAQVPTINGDQQDEGTIFSLTQSNISRTSDLVQYLTPVFPLANRSIVSGLVDIYPDDPTAGSPFNTFIFNNIYPQYKRLAALLGDVTFTLQRRIYLSTIANAAPTWSYISNYLALTPVLGTFHASDVLITFFDAPPLAVSEEILGYYIAFINVLDPNGAGSSGVAWPRYELTDRQMMEFGIEKGEVVSDDFREAQYKYLRQWQRILRV